MTDTYFKNINYDFIDTYLMHTGVCNVVSSHEFARVQNIFMLLRNTSTSLKENLACERDQREEDCEKKPGPE